MFALETWHAIVDPALGYSTKLLDGRCPRSHQRARWIIQGRRLWMAPNAAPQPPGSRPSPSAGNDQEQSAAAALRSVTSDAQDELECAFCALLMLPPYSICGNGHTACSACFEALEALPGPAAGDAVPGRCPSCREPLLAKPVRLLALETAAKRIAVSCRFAGAQGGHAEMERAGATRGGDSVFDAQVRLEGRLEAVQVVIALRAPTVTRGVGGVAHFQFGD